MFFLQLTGLLGDWLASGNVQYFFLDYIHIPHVYTFLSMPEGPWCREEREKVFINSYDSEGVKYRF